MSPKMRFYIISLIFSTIVVIKSEHLMDGTNLRREELYQQVLEIELIPYKQIVEYCQFRHPEHYNRTQIIRGILAFDRLDQEESKATAEILSGGVGFNHVNISFTSGVGQSLDYDIYLFS